MLDHLTREYSKRLGVLTGAQLQGALDRFGLGRLLDARPAPGGLFGQNVLLTTSEGGLVLRGCPHYDGQFEKERFFHRLIVERTKAAAPWPYLIEKSPMLFGWSYALMPLLPGVQLSDPEVRRSLTDADRREIAKAMGEFLALLQEATWEVPAVYESVADGLVALDSDYARWFLAQTRDWLERSRIASKATTDEDVAWVESAIAATAPALSVPFKPALVHTDYAEGNVVASRIDADWRVEGVFDLGMAYVGDGEYDLARPLCHYGADQGCFREFVHGYMASRHERPRFAERLSLYILTERLIIWEYGQRNHVWFPDPALSFRAWAEPFLSLAGKAAAL